MSADKTEPSVGVSVEVSNAGAAILEAYPPKVARCNKQRIKSMSLDNIKTILFDYYYGVSLKDLRRLYGVSAQTVYNLIKCNRLTPEELKELESRAKIQKLLDTNNKLIEENNKLLEQLRNN